MEFSTLTAPVKGDFLIAFADIQNFLGLAKGIPDSLDLFNLLNGIARNMIECIEGTPGKIVKFIGDACLIVYPEGSVDIGIERILLLKKKCEQYLAGLGFSNKLRISAHYGEAAIGQFGQGCYQQIDILGDSVNTASAIGRGEHRGRLVISPQLFRKLSSFNRKAFHKYTPPIVYIAD